MQFSSGIDIFISEKNRISYCIRLAPNLLIEDINQYMQIVKYEVSMAAWKQFIPENQFATMYTRLVTPVVYEFYEKFELGSIEQVGAQIEKAADKLCLKIKKELVMDIICSREFRNMKVVFEK